MKKCPKCSSTIENDLAKFCKKCGTDLMVNQPVAEIDSAREHIPDIGKASIIENDKKGSHSLSSSQNLVVSSPSMLGRHGFISFWLWLGVVVNGLSFLGYCLLLFSPQGLWSATPEPVWLRLIWITLSAAVLMGYWMLLKWEQSGFYVILLVQCVSIILNFALNLGITSLSPLVGLIILYSVLKIKKNGISYWEAMEMR